MLFLAVKNLVQQKTRPLISVGGVAFSEVLIMSIQGLYMGSSGSEKSNLLSMIGALLSPTAGRVLISGRDRSALGPPQLSRLRLKEFGFLLQPGWRWSNPSSDTGRGTCPGTSPEGRNSVWSSPGPWRRNPG